MSANKQGGHDVPISGHEYDGILELDNQLPRWWVYLFYITIFHSAAYFTYYILGPGPTLTETFEKERVAVDAAKLAAANGGGNGGSVDANALIAAFKSPESREKGKAVFTTRCVACHGPQGQGSIGPNLTDDYWIHGGSLPQIAQIVAAGVADKGMPPWGGILKPDELAQVTGYVKSIKGTNPPNPKAPQGDVYKGD